MMNLKNQVSELNKMSKKSFAIYHQIALSIGISDSALGILYALQERETPCSQYDLSNELFIPKQTINTTVISLKKNGLILLTPITGTRNKKNITLTDTGKDFVKKNISKLMTAEQEALKKLTPKERELYIYLNQKYNESLTEKLNCILEDDK